MSILKNTSVRSNRHSLRRPAFTLVELLVCIAIIVLLISTLIPALGQSREVTYMALCGNNLRQVGTSMGGYAAEWKGCIPPNITRVDGVDPTYGPYATANSTSTVYAASMSHYIGYVRSDNSGPANGGAQMNWYSGLGVMWSTGNIPYTLAGARLMWCPGERRANFMGTSKQSSLVGPGRYWITSGNTGLIDHPDSPIPGSNGGAWTVQSNYTYRSLGVSPSPSVTYNNSISKGSWQIDRVAKYVAVIDNAVNIYGDSKANPGLLPIYTHGQNAYAGMNMLGYDGHAKWHSDPSALWQVYDSPISTLAHDTGFGNSFYAAQWNLYDTWQ